MQVRAEECLGKLQTHAVTGMCDPLPSSPRGRSTQGSGCDSSRLRENPFTRKRILESGAKHMTEQTHGGLMSEGGRDRRKRRRDRGTEMIQVTQLLTGRERQCITLSGSIGPSVNHTAEDDVWEVLLTFRYELIALDWTSSSYHQPG